MPSAMNCDTVGRVLMFYPDIILFGRVTLAVITGMTINAIHCGWAHRQVSVYVNILEARIPTPIRLYKYYFGNSTLWDFILDYSHRFVVLPFPHISSLWDDFPKNLSIRKKLAVF